MKWVLFRLWVSLLLLISCQMQAQLPALQVHCDRSKDSLILDSMRTAFGKYKQIPPTVELQVLRALSHYPELAQCSIEFVFCKQKTAHSSQPKLKSILRKPSRRIYQVRISTEVPSFFTPGLHSNLPYDAQVGVLGHELGHTTAYLKRRFWGLVADGIRYGTSRKFVIRTEHATDRTTIDHQLGWQLLSWAQIAHPLLVQAGRGQNYMLPAEISALIGCP